MMWWHPFLMKRKRKRILFNFHLYISRFGISSLMVTYTHPNPLSISRNSLGPLQPRTLPLAFASPRSPAPPPPEGPALLSSWPGPPVRFPACSRIVEYVLSHPSAVPSLIPNYFRLDSTSPLTRLHRVLH